MTGLGTGTVSAAASRQLLCSCARPRVAAACVCVCVEKERAVPHFNVSPLLSNRIHFQPTSYPGQGVPDLLRRLCFTPLLRTRCVVRDMPTLITRDHATGFLHTHSFSAFQLILSLLPPSQNTYRFSLDCSGHRQVAFGSQSPAIKQCDNLQPQQRPPVT